MNRLSRISHKTNLFRAISWNTNKTSSYESDLQAFLSAAQFIPDIIAIQEPPISYRPKLLKSSHYLIEVQDLLVYSHFRLDTKIIEDTREAAIIRVSQDSMAIFVCYLRNGKKKAGIQSLIHHVQQETAESVLIMGDLNAYRNTAERALDTFLRESEFFHLLEEPTFFRSNRRPRQLDFVIAKGCGHGQASTINDLRSDHLGILFESECKRDVSTLNSSYSELYPWRALNLHSTKRDLSKFPQALSNLLSDDESWQSFRSKIYKALKQVGIRPGKPRLTQTIKPRLSPEAQLIFNERKTTAFKSTEYRILSKRLQRQIKIDRRLEWNKFVSSVNEKTPLWKMFSLSKGSDRIAYQPIDRVSESLLNAYQNPIARTEDLKLRLIEQQNICRQRSSILAFTNEDVVTAIRNCGNSSPGPDGIPYKLFAMMDARSISVLTDIFNSWLQSSDIDPCAFHRLIYAIPKSDGSSRGITLSNAILKIYERLILPHLDILEKSLQSFQYGFRKGRGAHHQLLRLITEGERQKNHIGIYFDIKKAFDRLDREILLCELSKMDINPKILLAIHRLLEPATVHIISQDQVSSAQTIDSGVPQGGILSPLLFSFYIRKLGLSCPIRKAKFFLYADDLAIIIPDGTIDEVREVFDYVKQYFYSLRLEVHPTKTVCMNRQISRKEPNWPDDLPMLTKQTKYLGAILDNNFTLKDWCKQLAEDLTKRSNHVKRIASTREITRDHLETLYNAYARGKIRYGISIWSKSKYASSVLNSDSSNQRFLTGAIRGTPTATVLQESRLMPLQDIILKADLKLYLAINSRPELLLLRNELDFVCDPLNESDEDTTLYYLGHQPFLCGLRDNFSLCDILAKIPPKTKRPSRFSFKHERLLSQIRMDALPTKVFLYLMGAVQDPLCRHCGTSIETMNHLLECTALNKDPLEGRTPSQILQGVKDHDKPTEDNILRYLLHENQVLKAIPTTWQPTVPANANFTAQFSLTPEKITEKKIGRDVIRTRGVHGKVEARRYRGPAAFIKERKR